MGTFIHLLKCKGGNVQTNAVVKEKKACKDKRTREKCVPKLKDMSRILDKIKMKSREIISIVGKE